MDRADQICTVVHCDVRAVIECGFDVTVIGIVVLAFDGVHRNFEVRDQRSSHIILRGQRIRSAEDHICPADLERVHQIGRFCSDVQAGRNPYPGQRLFPLETFADAA